MGNVCAHTTQCIHRCFFYFYIYLLEAEFYFTCGNTEIGSLEDVIFFVLTCLFSSGGWHGYSLCPRSSKVCS